MYNNQSVTLTHPRVNEQTIEVFGYTVGVTANVGMHVRIFTTRTGGLMSGVGYH